MAHGSYGMVLLALQLAQTTPAWIEASGWQPVLKRGTKAAAVRRWTTASSAHRGAAWRGTPVKVIESGTTFVTIESWTARPKVARASFFGRRSPPARQRK
jgi:hypothetical protein